VKPKLRPMIEWTTPDGRRWILWGNIYILVNHPHHDDDVSRFSRIMNGTYDENADEVTVESPNYRKALPGAAHIAL
jgi:hypothetical protein